MHSLIAFLKSPAPHWFVYGLSASFIYHQRLVIRFNRAMLEFQRITFERFDLIKNQKKEQS